MQDVKVQAEANVVGLSEETVKVESAQPRRSMKIKSNVKAGLISGGTTTRPVKVCD